MKLAVFTIREWSHYMTLSCFDPKELDDDGEPEMATPLRLEQMGEHNLVHAALRRSSGISWWNRRGLICEERRTGTGRYQYPTIKEEPDDRASAEAVTDDHETR